MHDSNVKLNVTSFFSSLLWAIAGPAPAIKTTRPARVVSFFMFPPRKAVEDGPDIRPLTT